MSAATQELQSAVNARVQAVIALHFDPEFGAPYWIEHAAKLNFDPRLTIRSAADLPKLGQMDGEALARLPVEAFIPRRFRALLEQRIVVQTGGTLGTPKFAVHREDEFEAAFVKPFVAAARRVNFPEKLSWLYLGPTGPHVIGRAARACARALGAPEPYCVDFDPRWAKKLPDASFARQRYVAHIEEQALQILNTQEVGVLFATPPVLESLGGKIHQARRLSIRGIHFGGMPVSDALRARLAEIFPNAILLSGYGNTLFGVAPELEYQAGRGIDYFPHGQRLLYWVIQPEQQRAPQDYATLVPYGERGQVLAHRLDEFQFIPNMLERDSAIRVAPPTTSAADGFVLDGLRDPQPIIAATTPSALGLY